MKIRFRRFEAGDRDAIARFNQRLRSAGVAHVVGREPVGGVEPSLDLKPVVERMFVAADGEEIRGAVWLKEQHFSCAKGLMRAGWMIYPVSESLVDKRFAGVPGTLLLGLLRRQPRLMALGMGGREGPFARLLSGAGWRSALVPFWFRILRPARVLRQLPHARSTRMRRSIADALAASGLAWVGHGVLTGFRRAIDGPPRNRAQAHRVDRFEGWADHLWEAHRQSYEFVAVRDRRALAALYPPDSASIARLRIQRAGRDLGWVCTQVLDVAGTSLEAHFGELSLGIITDAFANPSDASVVMEAGFSQLVEEGVDLIVTNQAHPAWCEAARRLGFWRGPSNIAFSSAPALDEFVAGGASCHLTRSDGDGPGLAALATRVGIPGA